MRRGTGQPPPATRACPTGACGRCVRRPGPQGPCHGLRGQTRPKRAGPGPQPRGPVRRRGCRGREGNGGTPVAGGAGADPGLLAWAVGDVPWPAALGLHGPGEVRGRAVLTGLQPCHTLGHDVRCERRRGEGGRGGGGGVPNADTKAVSVVCARPHRCARGGGGITVIFAIGSPTLTASGLAAFPPPNCRQNLIHSLIPPRNPNPNPPSLPPSLPLSLSHFLPPPPSLPLHPHPNAGAKQSPHPQVEDPLSKRRPRTCTWG